MSENIIPTITLPISVKFIEQQLKDINKENPFPNEAPGQLVLFTSQDDVEAVGHQYKDGDVCIYYDYCTDELPDENFDEWQEWYDSLFLSEYSLDYLMSEFGYKQIYEQDGSGGGLWYGGLVYRKYSNIE
jgi:hypothetical protein